MGNCPDPIDQEQINMRKELVFGKKDRRDTYQTRGRNGNLRTGGKATTDKTSDAGPGGGKATSNKRQLPKTGEEHTKFFDGKKLFWCGKCGKWGNHKTVDHKSKEELSALKEGKKEGEKRGFAAGATALNF